VSYVRLFRHDDRLEGEDDYYLTTIENAVQFLHDIKAADCQLNSGEQFPTLPSAGLNRPQMMEVIDISSLEENKKENLSLSDPSFLTDTDELI